MDVSYREEYAMNPEGARWRLVDTYLATGSLSQAVRRWHTSCQVVRNWVRRFQGGEGLGDHPRRPRAFPRRTPAPVEEEVLEARRKTGYGRKRLAWYLAREEGLTLSPHTPCATF